MVGIRNAKVFPLPVFAAPKRSLPARMCPIAALWMSFIVEYPAFARPSLVFAEMGNWLNSFGAVMCNPIHELGVRYGHAI
jgi:hypothetical protein